MRPPWDGPKSSAEMTACGSWPVACDELDRSRRPLSRPLVRAAIRTDRRTNQNVTQKCHSGSIEADNRSKRSGFRENRPNWLGGRDSNPDNVVQSHVSYR